MIYLKQRDATAKTINGIVNTKPKRLKFNIAIDVPEEVWSIGMIFASLSIFVHHKNLKFSSKVSLFLGQQPVHKKKKFSGAIADNQLSCRFPCNVHSRLNLLFHLVDFVDSSVQDLSLIHI